MYHVTLLWHPQLFLSALYIIIVTNSAGRLTYILHPNLTGNTRSLISLRNFCGFAHELRFSDVGLLGCASALVLSVRVRSHRQVSPDRVSGLTVVTMTEAASRSDSARASLISRVSWAWLFVLIKHSSDCCPTRLVLRFHVACKQCCGLMLSRLTVQSVRFARVGAWVSVELPLQQMKPCTISNSSNFSRKICSSHLHSHGQPGSSPAPFSVVEV